MTDTSKRTETSCASLAAALDKYGKKELISLLAHYEAELQAQELALSVLKAERKGKVFDYRTSADSSDRAITDAELALLRDASFELGRSAPNRNVPPLSETLYHSHINELENLVIVQRACNRKSKQTLNALEKHHAKILHEIHLEKERAQNNSLKSDEFFLLVENERSKVQAQLDQKDEEISTLESQLDTSVKALKAEKARERIMILYLFNERKQLLLRLNEMRMRLNNKNELEDSPLVQELRKQLAGLSNERNSLSDTVHALQSEKDILLRKVRHLEEDLLLIQQNVLHRTREQSETLERNARLDGLILANRGAIASENRQQQQQPSYYHHTHPVSHQRQTSQPSSITSTSQYAPQVSVSTRTGTAPSRAHAQKPPLALPQVDRTPSNYYTSTPGTITTTAATGIDSHAYANNKNSSTNTMSNGVPPSNHSTVLLHRSSGRPPLGIKASNLPLSRNTHTGALSNPVAYRPSSTGKINNLTKTITNNGNGNGGRRPFSSTQLPTSTSFPTSIKQQSQPSSSTMNFQRHTSREELHPVEYIISDTRNSETLTGRSSSLPRNAIQTNAQLMHNSRKINNNNHQNHNS